MRSKFEKSTADALKALKKIFWYEEVKIPYIIPAKKANYIPDFILGDIKPKDLEDLKGRIIIETKGYFKYSDRVKMIQVKESNPELDIRMVFMQNSYLSTLTIKEKQMKKDGTPFKKERYGDWCDKFGFPWAIGEIPDDWLKVD